MKLDASVKAIGFLFGLALLGMGAVFSLIVAIGKFEQGRAETALSAFGIVLAALPLLALPFSVRVAKILVAVFLTTFSSLILVAAFNPPKSVAHPVVYQVAAVILAALVLSRLAIAWRRRSNQAQA